MGIKSNIEGLRETIPDEVKIVAVSKFHSVDEIAEAYDAGQRIFGESRVQELIQKYQYGALPEDVEWHFVGQLQRNKVKQIAPFISLIHSLDSSRLMLEIEKQGAANNRVIPSLLQIHIADEESKSGFSPEEVLKFLADGKWRECRHLQLRGVMGMATYTDDLNQLHQEFGLLRSLFEQCKRDYFSDNNNFKEISMGMTGDYKIAVEEGSTMIRVGTLIFGAREN